MPRFLIAIPVFNEREHVRGVVDEVRRYARDILIVDDGSTDGTGDLLARIDGIATIRHAENRGYGQALISSFEYATDNGYEWLITMDCDRQHEPAFIPSFVEAAHRGDADIVSGSRYLHAFDGNSVPPADRRRVNAIITRMLNELLDLQITDAFCGFKGYRVSSLGHLDIDIPGYAMPLQLWVQAVASKLRIREIPIRLIYNDPNRHFGGMLDDPDSRLAHYVAVVARELARTCGVEGASVLKRAVRHP